MTLPRGSSQEGSVTLEAVLVAPIFVLLFLFVVFGGRVVGAKNHVVGAAQDAARAASLHQESASATADATHTADQALRSAGLACAHRDVQVDTGRFQPGGVVVVTVRCTARYLPTLCSDLL